MVSSGRVVKAESFYDRMFPELPPLILSDADVEALSNAMRDVYPAAPGRDNPRIPAGFSYLAQFIDHDLSFNPSASHAPRLTLDGVYGAGPGPHRFLFRRDAPKFLIGMTAPSKDARGIDVPATPNDLERNRHGVPLIADDRNDRNLVLAQTHVAFLKFHNKVVDALIAQGMPTADLFEAAAALVRRHYQWVVLHDYVERLVEPGLVASITAGGKRWYRPGAAPFLPLEFVGAVSPCLASMLRDDYSYNRVFRPAAPRLAAASLDQLFRFSSLSGEINGLLPGGFAVLPSNWAIDWRRWYHFPAAPDTADVELNSSRRISPFLAPRLRATTDGIAGRHFAEAQLRRTVKLGLPSGQTVAAAMQAQFPTLQPLTEDDIASGPDGHVARQRGCHTNTPLWYYLMKEAQIRSNGERFGPIAGRLFAEVFVGILEGDANSVLADPDWTPTLPSAAPGTFRMTDLLQFVGDISPLDGITTIERA